MRAGYLSDAVALEAALLRGFAAGRPRRQLQFYRSFRHRFAAHAGDDTREVALGDLRITHKAAPPFCKIPRRPGLHDA